jgi:hypothetical protein
VTQVTGKIAGGDYDSEEHFAMEAPMRGLVALGILLIVVWIVAGLLFKTAGFLIHLLLIVGAIMLIVGLLKRAGRAVSRDI